MAYKKKNELPSGNIRLQVYVGKEMKRDKDGNIITDKNGKPKYRRIYESVTAPTKTEAKLIAAEIKAKSSAMNNRQYSDLTLYELSGMYIDTVDGVLSPTTVQRYRVMRENSFKMLMEMKLKDITEASIQQAISLECQRKANRKNAIVSPNTVRSDFVIVSATLKRFAPNFEYRVKLPAKVKNVKELPEPEQILSAVMGSDIELPAMLAMWLSFTLSEVKGLKWSSIHGDKISIDQVVVTVNNKEIEKPNAKNEKRNRTLEIPGYIKFLFDQAPHDSEYIVSLSGAQVYKRFVKCITAAGLNHITFHDLRHVNASVMALLHIPDKYAQDRGGWKSPHIMQTIYMQTFQKERQEVDKRIDDYFNRKLGFKESEPIPYDEWLDLLSLNGNSETERIYNDYKLQHEMQHKKQKAQ